MIRDEDADIRARAVMPGLRAGIGIAIAVILIVALVAAGSLLSRDTGTAVQPRGSLASAAGSGYGVAGQSNEGPDIALGGGVGDGNADASGSPAAAGTSRPGTATSAPAQRTPPAGGPGSTPTLTGYGPTTVPTRTETATQGPTSGHTPTPTPTPTRTPNPTPTWTPTPYPVPSASPASPINGAWTTNRTLTWTYYSNGGPGQGCFRLQVSTSASFAVVDVVNSDVISSGSPTYAIPDGISLTIGTTYYWRVTVANGLIGSPWSATGSFNWGVVPGASPLSPVGGALTTSRTLYWTYYANGGPGQGCFRVQVSTSPDVADDVNIADSGVTCYSASNWTIPDGAYLAHGTTFYWHVTVANGIVGSAWSDTASFVWGG